jgi:hypothetical protein
MKSTNFLIINLLIMSLLPQILSAQAKNYTMESNRVEARKIKGEETYISPVYKNASVSAGEESALGTAATLGIIKEAVGPALNILDSILKRQLDKQLAKYTATYKSNKMLLNGPAGNQLNALRFTRKVKLKGKNEKTEAMHFVLERREVILQIPATPDPNTGVAGSPTEKKYFIFQLKELQMAYSKALIKNKYPFIDVSIEIEAKYLNSKSEIETQKSNPIVAQMIPAGQKSPVNLEEKGLYSNLFPAEAEPIEVIIRVTETNNSKEIFESIKKDIEAYSAGIKEITQTMTLKILENMIQKQEEEKGKNSGGSVTEGGP